MKASELIQRLEELIGEHGDLEVEYECSLDYEVSYSIEEVFHDKYNVIRLAF